MQRLCLLSALILLIGAGGAYAQTPPAAAPAPVPEVMPFDIPYGEPLTLADAQKATAAAMAEAKKHNWKMVIVVADPSGNLISLTKMDGAQFASIKIAQAKALTAAGFRRPTKAFADSINGTGGAPANIAQLSLIELTGGGASEGGFPVVIGGKLVGAVGCSGGISSQDGVTCSAAANVLMGK